MTFPRVVEIAGEVRAGRVTARAVWDMTDGAADSRIETLEREGLLKRLPVRPIMWERAA